jgi:hypothetical protein
MLILSHPSYLSLIRSLFCQLVRLIPCATLPVRAARPQPAGPSLLLSFPLIRHPDN